MKELSIEQKAKRYDESRERMKDFLKEWGNCGALGEAMEKAKAVFPELKESEGGRIRKAIINVFAAHKDYEIFFGVSVEDILAWLEKQGEQKPAWNEEDKNMLKWVTGYLDNKMLNTPIVEERTACKNAIAWLEKLEDKQKPADKVEPKFKVGQTIKKKYFNLGFTIVKIEDGFYYNNMGDYFPFTDQDNWELVESVYKDLKKLKE